MFGSNSKNNNSKLIIKTDGTVIGEGSIIQGNIKETGDITIKGKIVGDIDVQGLLILEETGIIEGNFLSKDAIIRGTVNGDVKVKENLRLDGPAKVNGNIEYKVISVEEGAAFNGNCKNISKNVETEEKVKNQKNSKDNNEKDLNL